MSAAAPVATTVTTVADPDIYSINCLSCAPREKEAYRTLFISKYCRVVFRVDPQPFFARVVIHPEEHFPNLFPEDVKEASAKTHRLDVLSDLYSCRHILKTAYTSLFGISRDNWVEAGNLNKDENGKPTCNPKYHHTHYHWIPRFEKPVIWRTHTFADETFTQELSIAPKHYPNEKLIKLSTDQYTQLKEDIQLHLLNAKLVPWDFLQRAKPSKAVLEAFKILSKF